MIEKQNPELPVAFVLMPFRPEFTKIYEKLVKPALEEAGYRVLRADSLIDQQNIMRTIIKGITGATLVVAELTTLNPNVLYELGIAHGVGVPTVLLAQSIEEVPFDLRSYNIQIYSRDFTEADKLKTSLKEVGERHLLGKVEFGSPVTDFATPKALIHTRDQITDRRNVVSEPSVFSNQEDIGILEAGEASQGFANIMIMIVEEINRSVGIISPLLARFDEATQSADLGKTSEAQQIAKQISAELEQSSERIEKYLPEIEDKIKMPFQVLLQHLSLIDPDEESSRSELAKYRGMFRELSEKVPLGLKGLKSYRNSVAHIGLRSGILGPSSRRNRQVVENIANVIEQLQSFISRALQVIDERMNDAH